jgi:hypothetical protein
MNRYLLPDDYFGVIEIFIYSVDYIYNIPHGPGPKKKKKQKDNERGINYPGVLKKRRIPHGDTKYLLGTVG